MPSVIVTESILASNKDSVSPNPESINICSTRSSFEATFSMFTDNKISIIAAFAPARA